MTKRNPEFGGFSACFAVRAETDQKGKATPPARTETWCGALTPLAGINFNPLRPRGRRRLNQDRTASIRNFNPLRPRGRRPLAVGLMANSGIFQPTPPARTETERMSWERRWMENFNPLRPRGRRQSHGPAPHPAPRFQPTPPARTETPGRAERNKYMNISTHSAREDGDYQYSTMEQSPDNFNPLRPRGRRLLASTAPLKLTVFQPTPPARTETMLLCIGAVEGHDFNPLRPRGRRRSL